MFDLSTLAVEERKPNLRKETQERLTLLCLRYNVSVKLKWSNGRRRGVFLKNERIVLLGPRAWNQPIPTLLHLFAHIICDDRCRDSRNHSYRFCETLWKLVIEAYKSPARYPWYGEHNSVFNFGRNRCKAYVSDRDF